MNLSASASGCTTAEFKWWALPPGGSWTVLRDWGTNTFAWNTTGLAAGSYKLGVWARAAGSSATLEASSEQSYMLAP